MYDTVAAVLTEVPPSALDPKRWQHTREVVDHATGEVQRRMTTAADGLLLALHGGGRALTAERSLPKALRGENVTDLFGPSVAVALATVDGEIAEAIGCWDLPSIGTWAPVRVDYPENIALGDEGRVLRTLERYAGIEMPYKGRPVVGQSHSVAWTKGDIRLKVYSKYQETKHDPRALGLLRVEPGVFRLRAFRQLLGRVATNPPTVLEVLTPDMHELVHERFRARLRGDAMTAKEIGDLDLAREMLAFFGGRRTASLIGWCALFALFGVESRADMVALDVASLPTRYRVLSDFRRFRDHLEAKGYMVGEATEPDSQVEEIVIRLGHAA